MFRYLNKIIRHNSFKKTLRSRRGQVAVVLIIVVAAALMFYAVSLNLSRVSQTKTLTTIAADTGASHLASYMASYGQSIYKTTLGGNRQVCGMTGVLATIIAVVIAIIAVVLAAPTGGTSLWLASASLVLAIGALVMQIAVIQPGLTDAWNDIIWHTMAMGDAFVEEGIQKALSSAVTDSVFVADLDDSDMDRVWGKDINGQPLDKIGRFGFYYTKQRLGMAAVSPSGPLRDFLAALKNFLYVDAVGDWGIFDNTGPVCSPFSASSECNPCCIPPGYWTEEMGCAANVSADPSIYVPDPAGVASMQTTCETGSPYGTNYPWVYDAYRGNPTNGLVSFQEAIGRDDEHQLFEKNPANPNGVQTSVLPPPPPLPPTNFKLKDTTGFYTPLVYPAADNRTGIFPFFYKISDWGVNLTALTTNNSANPECNWCDARGGTTCNPAVQPVEIPQLVLDPGTPPSGAVYNTTLCVDGANLVSGNPPLAVDKVKLPDAATGLIEADSTQCAQRALGNQAVGFWKRGGDRFCGTVWPYDGECDKYGPPLGTCRTSGTGCLSCVEPTTAPDWPDDLLDDVLYNLNGFIDWAKNTVSKDAGVLGREFKLWYPEAAQWIERGTNSGATNAPTCASCCYVCAAQDGALWKWYDEIREMKNRLRAWRDTSFAGASCTDVWCVPPGGCPGAPAPEAATFNSNPLTPPGDMAEVVACINWNANDVLTYSDSTAATGNADKFQACVNACAANSLVIEKCSNLPRSLVPGVNTGLPSADPAVVCAPGGWLVGIQRSIPEAQNQVVKFRKRYAFLAGRLDELNRAISVLDMAENEFYGFLTCDDLSPVDGQPDGAACRLIKARINFDNSKPGLPYHAIYGWQTAAEQGQPLDSGKWHIVRVEARIPGRCDSSCNKDQVSGGGDPSWPWVFTHEEDWGTRRCYELVSTDGAVKARVSRYDETSTLATLLFPNAVEIWKPSFTRVDRRERASPDGIESVCTTSMAPDPCSTSPCPLAPGTDYYGAFLLNEPNTDNIACWNLVNDLLTQGVTSEACARYYFHSGTPDGMDFQFVPCKNF